MATESDERAIGRQPRFRVATVGAAGVEVAQEVLAETQSAILPLVPYLLDAASRRPADRDALAQRMRDGRF